MRWRLLLLVGGVAPLAGCHLAEATLHNVVNEPAAFLDERHVTHELRSEAKKLLKELRADQPTCEEFEDGFVDGYADTLERGGEPLPPAVPPTRYRRGRFLNPYGHARIHDYFTGFSQGAAAAVASGKRRYLTVPVLLPDQEPEPTPEVKQIAREDCEPQADPPPKPKPKPKPAASTPLPKSSADPAPKPADPAPKPADPKPPEPESKKPTDGDAGLLPPKRPLLAQPAITLPLPEPLPGDGVVPPRPEPLVVVPPRPDVEPDPKR